jgi:hypothetical protein
MLTTIPAQDIAPGDLIELAPATRVQVRDVATIGGRTYVLRRESGALVPDAYTFAADALVSRYSAR